MESTSRYFFVCGLLVIAYLITPSGLMGDIQGFKDGIRKEQESNKKRKRDQTNDNKTGDTPQPSTSDAEGTDRETPEEEKGCVETCAGLFFQECFRVMLQFTGKIWFLHNMSVYYNDYPYQKDRSFFYIGHDHDVWRDDARLRTPVKGRSWRYTVTTGPFLTIDTGSGFFFGCRGKVWTFIGPEIDYTHLWDTSGSLLHLSLGVNISFIQFDRLSVDGYIQYSLLDHLSGIAGGLLLTSYPVTPLSLFLRMGGQVYRDISFFNAEGRIGAVIYRFNPYVGYRHTSSALGYASVSGPLIGGQVYF